MSTPLQRVTPLRRRVQDNAPTESYWFRHVLDGSGPSTRRVHRARGAGGAEPAMNDCLVYKRAEWSAEAKSGAEE